MRYGKPASSPAQRRGGGSDCCSEVGILGSRCVTLVLYVLQQVCYRILGVPGHRLIARRSGSIDVSFGGQQA